MKMEYSEETLLYLKDEERLSVAWELLVYASNLYKRVYIFKNLEAFAESFSPEPNDIFWEAMSGEKMVDFFKICTAFENYNKAALLIRRFMVHTIDPRKNKALASEQKSVPISIEDFRNANQYVLDDKTGEWYLDGLQNFVTITFSCTLKPGYQAWIELDNQFVEFLKGINQERNKLHLYKNYYGAFNKDVFLKQLRYAKDYGEKILIGEIQKVEKLQNDIQ